MTNLAQRVRAQIAETADQQIEFLTRLVALETPTEDPLRTRQGLELLAAELDGLGYRYRIFSGKKSGGQLLAVPRERKSGLPIQLLIGHVDTVWPTGTIADMPVVIEDGRMKGPGVFDMKAGLSNALFALRTLKALELEPAVTPVLFINTDEETGSDESLPRLCQLARFAERVYVMEPALGITGKLKTARKGVGHYDVTAHGIAAHAGLNPEGGASAILELAHVVQSLFALNDHHQGVSINVGRIDGGLGANIVAPSSSCQVDVRVPSADHAVAVDAAIHRLKSVTPGVSLEIKGGLRRPPLEPSPTSMALCRGAQDIAAELGFELEEGMAGGGSDGNNTSQYITTLDGLGAVGDGAHARHEFIFVDQLFDRTAMLALLVMAPSRTQKQEDLSCKVSCALP
jgi:glutamate carboxypeptidase